MDQTVNSFGSASRQEMTSACCYDFLTPFKLMNKARQNKLPSVRRVILYAADDIEITRDKHDEAPRPRGHRR
jgi:hypothetical protein